MPTHAAIKYDYWETQLSSGSVMSTSLSDSSVSVNRVHAWGVITPASFFLFFSQLNMKHDPQSHPKTGSQRISRRGLLRSLGRCCLRLVALLVAGGAAGVLPVSLSCPLPLRRTHPPTVVCCFRVFAEIGVTSTISGRLEVNLSLSEKRGGKRHLGTMEQFYFRLFQNLEISHGHPFVATVYIFSDWV